MGLRDRALLWLTVVVLAATAGLLIVVNGWEATGRATGPEAPAGFPTTPTGRPAMALLLDAGGTDLLRVRSTLHDRGASATLVGARPADGSSTAEYVDDGTDAVRARLRAADDEVAPLLLRTAFDRGPDGRLVVMEHRPDGTVVLRQQAVLDLGPGSPCPRPGPDTAVWVRGPSDPASWSRFTGLVDGLVRCGTAPTAVDLPPQVADKNRALALVGAVASVAGPGITTALLLANLLAMARSVVSALAALTYQRRLRRHRGAPQQPVERQPVSILVPVFNEAAGILATLRSIIAAAWPGCEIIVVDDGSTDATARLVREAALPMVTLVSQPNAGKPQALNTGLARTRNALIVMVDGDTVLRPDALAILHDAAADPELGAVSGNVKVSNRTNLLTYWQHLEFVNGYNLDRRLYHLLGAMPTVPGAFGLFKRTAIDAVGGVSDATIAEDTDLTIAIQMAGFRVEHETTSVAYTEAPAAVPQLYSQRFRWTFGTLQALWKHRRMSHLPPQARTRGRVLYGYLFAFQLLLPILSLFGDVMMIYLIMTDIGYALFLLALVVALQCTSTAMSLRMDDERLWPLVLLPLQHFFFRQFLYVVVIHSLLTALLGTPVRWQKLRRLGSGHTALATLRGRPALRTAANGSPAHPATVPGADCTT